MTSDTDSLVSITDEEQTRLFVSLLLKPLD